jgi:hypothetical protein
LDCSVIEEEEDEEEDDDEEEGYRAGLTNMVTTQFRLWLRNFYRVVLVGTT